MHGEASLYKSINHFKFSLQLVSLSHNKIGFSKVDFPLKERGINLWKKKDSIFPHSRTLCLEHVWNLEQNMSTTGNWFSFSIGFLTQQFRMGVVLCVCIVFFFFFYEASAFRQSIPIGLDRATRRKIAYVELTSSQNGFSQEENSGIHPIESIDPIMLVLLLTEC